MLFLQGSGAYIEIEIMANQELSEQEVVRRNSMQALRDRGIEPYPAAEYVVTGHSKEIKENFSDDAPQREVAVAGRIMSRRIMGKASFVELQDADGRIQVYISRDDLCPVKTRTCTMWSSRNSSTSATSSVSKVSSSALRWGRSLSMRRRSLSSARVCVRSPWSR